MRSLTIFLLFTLLPAYVATAQSEEYRIANRTSEDVYLIYSTYQSASNGAWLIYTSDADDAALRASPAGPRCSSHKAPVITTYLPSYAHVD